MVFDFGAVVYWSCSEPARERLRQHVKTVTGRSLLVTEAEDTLPVVSTISRNGARSPKRAATFSRPSASLWTSEK